MPNLAVPVEDDTSNEIADVSPSRLKPGAFRLWNLQFAADQRLSVRNRVNARKLQDQITLVRPKLFNFQFPPRSIIGQSPQPHTLVKSVRDVAVQLGCNFAASSLRLNERAPA